MRKSNITFCSVIGVSLLVLAGCASQTTTADLMKANASEIQAQADLQSQLAKEWKKGTKLVATGEKRVKNGEKRVKLAERDLKRGQDDIELGSREIAEGQQLIQESKRQFRETFPEVDIEPVK